MTELFECPCCGRIVTKYNYIRHCKTTYHIIRQRGLKPKKINKNFETIKKTVPEIKISFI